MWNYAFKTIDLLEKKSLVNQTLSLIHVFLLDTLSCPAAHLSSWIIYNWTRKLLCSPTVRIYLYVLGFCQR